MPSSGAVIDMLCSAEGRQPGCVAATGMPDRQQTLEGFLASIWPWGRTAAAAAPEQGDTDVPSQAKDGADTKR